MNNSPGYRVKGGGGAVVFVTDKLFIPIRFGSALNFLNFIRGLHVHVEQFKSRWLKQVLATDDSVQNRGTFLLTVISKKVVR